MADLLNMAYINSLPQPFLMRSLGTAKDSKWWWPVHDIDVQTGLVRIDVMGKLDITHIRDTSEFQDASGTVHNADTFYSDYAHSAELKETK